MLTKFTVKRSEWLNGNNVPPESGSGLYRPEPRYGTHNRCVLGHYCEQSGVPRNAMANIGLPCSILMGREFVREAQWGGKLYDLVNSASTINDHRLSTQEMKEKELINLFNSHGIKLTFED